MRMRLKRWVASKADDNTLLESWGTFKFALHITIKVTIVANAINITLQLLLHVFDILPFKFSQAMAIGCLSTTVIAGGVGFMFAFFVGDSIREVAIRRDLFQKLSSIDPLSQLFNRRSFFEVDQPQFGSLMIFDIDHFKKINDKFGHQVGDEIIQHVATALSLAFQPMPSRVARIGGEEFAVFAAVKNATFAHQTAEKVLASIADAGIQTKAGTVSCTVSAGVADWREGCSLESLYGRADEALYIAKAKGRNCLVHEADLGALPKMRVGADDLL